MMRLFFICLCLILVSCKKKIEKHGCFGRANTITFDSGYLGIPNIITPNGDGSNDILALTYNGIKTFDISIKNSFGKTVHTATHPSESWDGTNKKGKVKSGMFKFECSGTSTTNDPFNLSGEIAVIGSDYKGCVQNFSLCASNYFWDGQKLVTNNPVDFAVPSCN